MTSCQKNLNTKENTIKKLKDKILLNEVELKGTPLAISMWIPDDNPNPDGWELLEDALKKRKKVRLNSKYSEKRYIP